MPDGNTKWSVYDHSQISNDASEAEDDTSVVNDGISNAGGYTQAELNDMIAEQEKKIKELDLNKRKAELEVEKLKAQSSDGMIYATVTGIVKNLQDKRQSAK